MSTPQERGTAAVLLSPGQMVVGLTLVLLALVEATVSGPHALARTVIAIVIVFYMTFVALKLVLWLASLRSQQPYEYGEGGSVDLPKYTVLLPLHDEAKVVGRIVKAMKRLVYPTDKLEVLLLLEEDDHDTIAAAQGANLPAHFKVVVVPDVGPRTKPKACNYGFQQATGDRVVIYDAEDRPDPNQLLTAVYGFKAALTRNPRIGCLQAVLSFWNPRRSVVSLYYWAEYVIHFNWTLPGMARLGLIPPLGGTSNHFLMEALRKVSAANGTWVFHDKQGRKFLMEGPWDPYNVTEDADLAARLYEAGYTIDILQGAFTLSTTYEEAPNHWMVALKQRTRWLLGYEVTGLVHTRQPVRKIRSIGLKRYLAFNLFMLGTPLSLFLNPIMWALTLLYIVARLDGLTAVTTFIDGLFPPPVNYAGVVVMVGGNALLFIQNLMTPLFAQQQAETAENIDHELAAHLHDQEYGLVGRLLLTPLWWAFTSISAWRAARKLLSSNSRSKWEKTPHGADMATEDRLKEVV